MFEFKNARALFFATLLSFEIFETSIVAGEKPETEDSKKISWVCDVPKDVIVRVMAGMIEKRMNEEFSCGCAKKGWFYFIAQRKTGDETYGGIYLYDPNVK